MENNTVIEQGTVTVDGKEQEERTFTQSELDAIIKDRLFKERQKRADYEDLKEKAAKFDEIQEANKSELQKAIERADALQSQIDSMNEADKLRNIRLGVSKETNVPVELLNGSTPEECMEQAKAILEFAKPGSYPSVRDGGETIKNQKKSAEEQFAEWFHNALG